VRKCEAVDTFTLSDIVCNTDVYEASDQPLHSKHLGFTTLSVLSLSYLTFGVVRVMLRLQLVGPLYNPDVTKGYENLSRFLQTVEKLISFTT